MDEEKRDSFFRLTEKSFLLSSVHKFVKIGGGPEIFKIFLEVKKGDSRAAIRRFNFG